MKRQSTLVLIILITTLISCSTPEQKRAKHMERGIGYYNNGKYNEAIIEFKNVIQVVPKDAEGHYRLGLAYLKSGKIPNLPNAYKELTQAVELNPDITDAHLHIGNLFLLSREYEKAREKGEIVLKKETGNVDAHLLLGNALAGLKRGDEAIGEIRKAIE